MTEQARPLRILIVCPSWVGDAVMATPALARIRRALPGAYLGALCRPGIDQILDGSGLIDAYHVAHARGVMGPKRAASKVRGLRYDTALLLTNSFSTALVTRLAFIPRRIGYDRDGRGILLTRKLPPPRNPDGSWKIVPAVDYYLRAADELLELAGAQPPEQPPALVLAPTDEQTERADRALQGTPIARTPFALLVPGGNNPAKRWPAERFAALAEHLIARHDLSIALSGSPDERELLGELFGRVDPTHRSRVCNLADVGLDLGALKRVVQRCSLAVCNDTGPRHIAAALGVPTVTFFGPTDHRWTTLPQSETPHELLLADPTLPEGESANDHPERCSIDRISLQAAVLACDRVLQPRVGTENQPAN